MTLAAAIAWNAQILLLVAAAGLTVKLLRWRSPRVRLGFYQALLAACLALPLLEAAAPAATRFSILPAITRITVTKRSVAGGGFPPLAEILFTVYAIGVALRLGWMCLGLYRLRYWRQSAVRAAEAHESVRKELAVNADIYISTQARGPFTYGWLRPVVLLPASLAGDRTVAFHELIHVRRRDWLFVLLEQAVRTVFWFHPALWWLTSEIQLAREQAVDRHVVERLHVRDSYLETLLALAAARAGVEPAPVPPFLRRHHLRARVDLLTREVTMSKLRFRLSFAALVMASALTGWASARALPLYANAAHATADSNDKPNTGVKQIRVAPSVQEANLIHKVVPKYPPDAKKARIQGTVVLDATISKDGHVLDLKTISGPNELIPSALTAVKQWVYRPTLLNGEPIQVLTRIEVNYTLLK